MFFKFIGISSLKQSKWELPFRYQPFEKFGRAFSLLLRETISISWGSFWIELLFAILFVVSVMCIT